MFGSDQEALSYAQEVSTDIPFSSILLAGRPIPHWNSSDFLASFCVQGNHICLSASCSVEMLMRLWHDAEGVACEGRQNQLQASGGEVSTADAVQGPH